MTCESLSLFTWYSWNAGAPRAFLYTHEHLFSTAANAWPIPCKYSYLRHIHGCNYLGNLNMLLQGISRHHFWMTTHLWAYMSPIYIVHQVIWNKTYFHVGCGLVQRFWLTDSFSLKYSVTSFCFDGSQKSLSLEGSRYEKKRPGRPDSSLQTLLLQRFEHPADAVCAYILS